MEFRSSCQIALHTRVETAVATIESTIYGEMRKEAIVLISGRISFIFLILSIFLYLVVDNFGRARGKPREFLFCFPF